MTTTRYCCDDDDSFKMALPSFTDSSSSGANGQIPTQNPVVSSIEEDLNHQRPHESHDNTTMLSELLNEQKWEEIIPYLLTPRGEYELRQTMCMNGIDAWSRDATNASTSNNGNSDASMSNNEGRGNMVGSSSSIDDSDDHRGYALHHPFLYRLRAYGRNDNPKPIAPLWVIEALIRTFPEGVTYRDFPLRNLPLHRAASNPWDMIESVDRVGLLLQAYPEGAAKTNNNGELPLHLACQCLEHCPVHGIVSTLLRAYPDGAKVKDHYGNLPIHTLCNSLFLPNAMEHRTYPLRNKDCVSVFQSVVSAYPEGLNVPTIPGGELPIHLLCQHRMSSVIPQLVHVLIMACPDTALKEDRRGNLPIHLLTKNLYFHWQDYKESQLELMNSMMMMQEDDDSDDENDDQEENEMLTDEAAPADNIRLSNQTANGTSQTTTNLESPNNGRILTNREAAAVEVHHMVYYGEQTLLLLTDKHGETLRVQSSLGFLPLNLLACLNKPSQQVWNILIQRCPGILLETDETGNSPLSSRVTTLAKYEKQWPNDPIVDLRHAIFDPTDALHVILHNTVRNLMSLSSCSFTIHSSLRQQRPVLSSLIYEQPLRWMAQMMAYCGHMFHPEDMKLIFGIVFDLAPGDTMINMDRDSRVFHNSALMHILCGAPWPPASTNNPTKVPPNQCIKDEDIIMMDTTTYSGTSAQQQQQQELPSLVGERDGASLSKSDIGPMHCNENDNENIHGGHEGSEQQKQQQQQQNPLQTQAVSSLSPTSKGPGLRPRPPKEEEYWSSSRETPARTLLQAYLKNEPRFVAERTASMMNGRGELPLHCLLKTPQQWGGGFGSSTSTPSTISPTNDNSAVAGTATSFVGMIEDGSGIGSSSSSDPLLGPSSHEDELKMDGAVYDRNMRNWPIFEDVHYLLHQYPDSVDIPDGITGLMPFMLPSVVLNSSSSSNAPVVAPPSDRRKSAREREHRLTSLSITFTLLKEYVARRQLK